MRRTVALDRWKALKMSARKLARDARALQKAARAPARPHEDAKAARAGDWPRQRPRPSSSGARPEDLTMLSWRKEVTRQKASEKKAEALGIGTRLRGFAPSHDIHDLARRPSKTRRSY